MGRVTRRKSAKIKVEKETERSDDVLLNNVPENKNPEHNDQENADWNESYTEMGPSQKDAPESEPVVESTNVENQSPDENNNFAEISPLKTSSPLKRTVDHDSENEAEIDNSPSPTKQSKLEPESINESVTKGSVELQKDLEVLSDKKDDNSNETEDLNMNAVNATEHDTNLQHYENKKDTNDDDGVLKVYYQADGDNNSQTEYEDLAESDNKAQSVEVDDETDTDQADIVATESDNEDKVQNIDPDDNDHDEAEDEAVDDDCDKEATAEEIVQKLCKNGKVLTMTEGENYFKVIVYEDSNETRDDNDTLDQQKEGFDENNNCQQQSLLQKIVDGDFDDEDTQSVQSDSQHILTDRTNFVSSIPTGVTQTVTPAQLISAVPLTVAESRQWYSDVCSPVGYTLTSQAAAIQSNFSQTMNQFAPAFLATEQQPDTQEQTMPLSNIENTPHFVQPITQQATASQRLFCTPHPKNGQYMFYYTDAEGNATQASFIPFNTSTPVGRPKQRGSKKSAAAASSVILNSSGEENQSPTDIIPSPTPTPNDKKSRARAQPRTLVDPDIEYLGEDGTIREQHNQKERRRRARIKEACDLMRQLVPGMSEKTDKATVFEFGARYIHFLKSFIGTQHDKDFLMKYSPY